MKSFEKQTNEEIIADLIKRQAILEEKQTELEKEKAEMKAQLVVLVEQQIVCSDYIKHQKDQENKESFTDFISNYAIADQLKIRVTAAERACKLLGIPCTKFASVLLYEKSLLIERIKEEASRGV
ncbi:hypothetical protein EYV94_10595 [Puteibacter caeruleilacunae]|nr:hypothetical protein EYV94_10595 [Puteibacter caeruleilacunae]